MDITNIEQQHCRALFLVTIVVLSLPAMSAGAIAGSSGDFSGTQEQSLSDPSDELLGMDERGDSDAGTLIDDDTSGSLDLNLDTASEEEGGTVYVGSDDNNLYAINAETGDQEWSYDVGHQIRSSPTVSDGIVFVGSKEFVDEEGDNFHAVDAETGEKEWSVDLGDESIVDTSPTVASGIVYVKAGDSRLYALNAETGETKWSYSTGDGGVTGSSPTVVGETVYVGSHDNNLYAIDALTGEERWSYETEGDIRSSPTVGSGIVYVGSYDNHLYAIDAETGDEEWSYDTSNPITSSPTVADGAVFIGSDGDILYSINADSGESEWSETLGVGAIESSPTVANGVVYVGSTGETLHAHDAETGTEEWVYEANERIRSSPTVADGTVYIGSYSHNLLAVETGTGDEKWSYSTGDRIYSSPTFVSSDSAFSDGSRVDHRTLGHHDGDSHNFIAGQVVDQQGQPIEDASVVATGVTEDILNVDFENYESIDEAELGLEDTEQELQEINDQLENTRPDDYVSALDITDDVIPDVEAEYAVVHENEDWDMSGTNLYGDSIKTSTSVDPDLDEPNANVPINEPVVISVWDAKEEGGFFFGQDVVDENLYGSTTSGTIVIEQLGPGDEILDSTTVETHDFVEVTSGPNVGTKNHEAATYSFSGGFYRIYPESNPSASYVITAGSATSIVNSWNRDLQNDRDELTREAEELNELIEEETGAFVEDAKTGPDGEFSFTLPEGTNEANLEAYKADGTALDAVEQPSISKLEQLQNDGYEGVFYIPTDGSKTTNTPTWDAELTLTRVDTVPQSELDWFNLRLQDAVNDYLDRGTGLLETGRDLLYSELEGSEIEGFLDENLRLYDELDDSDLDELADRINGVDNIDRDDLYDEDGNPLPADEIAENIGVDDPEDVLDAIDDTVSEADEADPIIDSEPPGDGDVWNPTPDPNGGDDDSDDDGGILPDPEPDPQPIRIEDGELFVDYPVPDGVDEDDVLLELQWSDGKVESVDNVHWYVDDSGFFGDQNHVILEDYPVHESDPAALTVDLRINTDDGIIDDDLPVRNPAFTGDIPAVNVNLNTMSPGPNEQVSVTLRPEEFDEFGELDDLAVFDPDGNEIDAEIDTRDRATFETDGAGVYHVRPEFTDATDELFAQSFKIEAGETSRVSPSTVRLETSAMGTFAIAGEGLTDAEANRNRDKTEIVATIPANNDSPGEIHIRPDTVLSGSENTLDVSVVRGADAQTVNDNVGVIVHLDSLHDDALHYKNGNPITWDGDTRFGVVEERGGVDSDKHVIRTYTDSDGQATIEINEDPSARERLSHWWSVVFADPPFLFLEIPDLFHWFVGSGVSLGALWIGRRYSISR